MESVGRGNNNSLDEGSVVGIIQIYSGGFGEREREREREVCVCVCVCD